MTNKELNVPGLQEAAEKYRIEINNSCDDVDDDGYMLENTPSNAFIAGAKWMAEQGETQLLKADIDWQPHGTDYGFRRLIVDLPDWTPEGTEYIVQIRKAE